MNPPTTSFPSYLLPSVFNPRYHQHLNHLNDMAFTHTKMLQELIEKRSIDSSSTPSSSPSSSISPMAATSNDSIQQKKRSNSYLDNNNNEEQQQQQQRQQQEQQKILIKRSKINDDNEDDDDDDDNHLNKRSRKQLKPQQLVTETNRADDDEQSSSEEEIGEVHSQDEKQNVFSIPQSPILPFSPHSLPFLNYIQDLARTNNITSPISMARFLENLQKEFFSPVHNAGIETKRIAPSLPPVFSQTVHHHHHPYISQILFNNSFINHYTPPPLPPPPMIPFGNTLADRTFPFRLSTPKKRRTKVTDTRLSPRITSKIISHEDLIEDDKSLSNHSFESTTSNHQQSTIEYNAFQISILF
ncbi:unnamed protein product [Rotaria sp. Silwood1]|nr:unnamed protein product [Rotaria sp. Silwood1]CAF1574764.1 unnamed protein product [Rotaria sp. Silwood1]CAF3684861.1 unnamed protein product [Rotaria sp. Silwood1]CAF4800802.1 unnamed protein product [Rotaria sp. Silwood1]